MIVDRAHPIVDRAIYVSPVVNTQDYYLAALVVHPVQDTVRAPRAEWIPARSPRSGLPTGYGLATNVIVRNSMTALAIASGSFERTARTAVGSEPTHTAGRTSTAEGSDGVHSTNDVTPVVRGVGLADVCQGVGIAEDVEGLFELGEIVRAEDYRGRTPVPGDRHASVFSFDAVDDITEVVADLTE